MGKVMRVQRMIEVATPLNKNEGAAFSSRFGFPLCDFHVGQADRGGKERVGRGVTYIIYVLFYIYINIHNIS